MWNVKSTVCFVYVGLVVVFLSAADAQALSPQMRENIIEKKLSCFSQNASRKDIGWEDICVTQDKDDAGRFGDELEENSSLDEMILRHERMADDMLKEPVIPDDTNDPEKTIEDIIEKNKKDPDAEKTMDDVIEEQGILKEAPPAETAQERYQLAQAGKLDQGRDRSYLAGEAEGPAVSGVYNSFERGVQDINDVEVGFEYNRFRYEEDVFDLVDKGNLFGAYLNYAYRPARGSTALEDVIDVYKLEGRFNYGKVDYESAPSGTIDGITDWTYEVRFLIGRDLVMGKNLRLTPLVGLGYRYLNDDTSGMQSSTGAFGYEREANYFYAPVGVELAARIADSWIISPSVEYDIFIRGRQESHLSDVPGGGLPDLSNKQHDGYGFRGSIKLIKELPSVSLVVEPYYRFWDIEDSATSTAVGSGFIVTGLEPANTSEEYGVRLGAIF